ncbi:MAG: hypothetical protein ACRDKZ_02610 [Actinomycetota bacterium]
MYQRSPSRTALVRTVAMGLLLCVVFAASSCSDVEFIEQLTIVNETDYPANVAVADGRRNGWLILTTSNKQSTTTVEQVIDQGEVWTFRWDYAGRHEEEVEVNRDDLERSDWRVEVPQSFHDALQELGIPPPPE